jgi:phenylacetate-CoA ligase
VRPGEIGFITVTDLDNDLLPLIRYQVGDVGHYYEAACSCGRGFPLMGEIDGRARDLFFLRSGSMVAPARIAAVFQDEPAVTLFQVIQNLNNDIAVKIVPNKNLYASALTERIQGRLTELLGPDEKIVIALVERIDLEPNGKCSFVKKEQRS